MPDVIHYLTIHAPVEKVFKAISTPAGLDTWWTKTSSGNPGDGEMFKLGFGPDNQWKAKVIKSIPNQAFELELTEADPDWQGTYVGIELKNNGNSSQVAFHHSNWREANDHYKISCYCWAMYLRLLKRYVEHGEFVPYEIRLEV